MHMLFIQHKSTSKKFCWSAKSKKAAKAKIAEFALFTEFVWALHDGTGICDSSTGDKPSYWEGAVWEGFLH